MDASPKPNPSPNPNPTPNQEDPMDADFKNMMATMRTDAEERKPEP